MIIKMLTTAAGPEGILLAGKSYDLPAEQTRQLINGKYAVSVVSEDADNANKGKRRAANRKR